MNVFFGLQKITYPPSSAVFKLLPSSIGMSPDGPSACPSARSLKVANAGNGLHVSSLVQRRVSKGLDVPNGSDAVDIINRFAVGGKVGSNALSEHMPVSPTNHESACGILHPVVTDTHMQSLHPTQRWCIPTIIQHWGSSTLQLSIWFGKLQQCRCPQSALLQVISLPLIPP